MIYFDNAATTPILEKCIEIVTNYNSRCFFNPSAKYHSAVDAFKAISEARQTICDVINCSPSELFFTSSGSESDNWAIKGIIKKTTDRLIVSEAEHPAVYNVALYLKNCGYDVQFCKVDSTGVLDIKHLESLLTKETKLVSVMHVNNETGAINDIATISQLVKSKTKALVHSDGVQAFGKIAVDVEELGVDLYTISGHKIHAPKGVAGLYVKKGVNIVPLIHGGGQESNYRSSTENVSGIVAFAESVKEANANRRKSFEKVKNIRDYLAKRLIEEFGDDVSIITNIENSSPYVLYFSLSGVRGEVLLHSLELKDIFVSTGSACSSKKGVSRLAQAIGLSENFREGTIRLSFSRFNELYEADAFLNEMIPITKELLKYRRK